jgi:hypothetical protein
MPDSFAGLTPKEREQIAVERGITWDEHIRPAFAKWYYTVTEATREFNDSLEFSISEDLGDWTETIGTLLSFGPNPRAFDPPILPEEEA